jgi:hypothetical protein
VPFPERWTGDHVGNFYSVVSGGLLQRVCPAEPDWAVVAFCTVWRPWTPAFEDAGLVGFAMRDQSPPVMSSSGWSLIRDHVT